MKTCPICKKENDDTAKFCTECGYKFNVVYENPVQQQIYTDNFNTGQQYYQQKQSQPYQDEIDALLLNQLTEKKPVYKKWWFWILVVITFILIINFFFYNNIEIDSNNSSSENKFNNSYSDNSEYNFIFDNAVIFNENDIKIETISSKINTSGATIDLYIENNTDKKQHIYITEYAINGIMIDDVSYSYSNENEFGITSYILDIDIPSEKKANSQITIPKESLEKYDIKQICNVTVLIECGNISKEKTEPITFKTKYNNELNTNFENKIFADDIIMINQLSLNNNSASFCLYNQSEHLIEYEIDNVSINDWAYDVHYIDRMCFPNCISLYKFEPDKEFFNNNNIKAVNKIEFELKINPDGYYTERTYTTPIITIN